MGDEITSLSISLDLFMQVPRAENRQVVADQLNFLYQQVVKQAGTGNIAQAFNMALDQVNWGKYSEKQIRQLADDLSSGGPVQNLAAHYLVDRMQFATEVADNSSRQSLNWPLLFKDIWSRFTQMVHFNKSLSALSNVNKKHISDRELPTNSNKTSTSQQANGKLNHKSFVPFSADEYEDNVASLNAKKLNDHE